MQPDLVSSGEWNQVKDAVLWLWMLYGTIILFAGSMLISRALVPSGLITRSAPLRARVLVPVFYAAAALALAAAIFSLVMFIDQVGVLYDIWGRPWV